MKRNILKFLGIILVLTLFIGCTQTSKINLTIDRGLQYACDNKFRIGCEASIAWSEYDFYFSKHSPEESLDSFFFYLTLQDFDKVFFRDSGEKSVALTLIKIQKIPSQVFSHADLEVISLRGSNDVDWSTIFTQLKDFVQLKSLNISARRCDTLTILSSKISKITTLQRLSIGNAVLDDFPLGIKYLKKLDYLSIKSKDCDKYVFEKVIRYLPNLKEAKLRDGHYKKENGKWVLIEKYEYKIKPGYCNYFIISP
jgi:hypothetical protein